RAPHQAPALSSRLRDLGARVTEVPVIVLASPADGGVALARAADGASRGAFGWVVFTSANAVERFFAFVPDTRALATTKVAAVGPATAAALARYRVVPDLVPAATRAQGVLAEFAKLGERAEDVHPAPARVLLPQAAGAQPELAHGLRRLGWEVEVCEAYRTQNHPVGRDLLVAASRADAICFASPSSVRAYIEQVRAVPGASVPALVACIGPVTAEAARACGLSVGVEADEQSVAGLADALVSAWPARRR
ncbi:MAG TPA: uroporphyrinogen-III synthase, partial [Acidimicrobiales bacterium]|nr:uroporphyrinogen-III synthase [Acidimicrobiales bacterium]